jgi:hypothetical protein
MAVLKIRNELDTEWIEIGGRQTIIQQDAAPADPYAGMMWLDTDEALDFLSVLRDADGDTKIQCEESEDEDKIRMDVAGNEVIVVGPGTLALKGLATTTFSATSGSKVNNAGIQLSDSDGKLFSFNAFGRDYAGGDFASVLALYNWTETDYTTIWRAGGEVSLPSQPHVYAWGTLNQDIATSTDVKLTWSEQIDIGNNFASSTFTAPVDGKYLVYASILMQQTADFLETEYWDLKIWVNAAGYHHRRIFPKAVMHYPMNDITAIVDLDANDTLDIRTFHTSGVTEQIYMSTGLFSYLNISLIA